jgi:predicted DNA binding protein
MLMLQGKIKISSMDNIVGRLSSEMDVMVEIIRCKANGPEGGLSILRIRSGPGIKAEDIREWFAMNDGCSVASIVPVSPGIHIAMVSNAGCRLCRAFIGSDCFLESGCTTVNGSVIWRVYTPNNTSLKGMIERIRKEGCKVELLSVKRVASSYELTLVQDEAMRLALSTGYYDIPKRITLEELAARSGISKATLNLILRRGQKKIISDHMRP